MIKRMQTGATERTDGGYSSLRNIGLVTGSGVSNASK